MTAAIEGFCNHMREVETRSGCSMRESPIWPDEMAGVAIRDSVPDSPDARVLPPKSTDRFHFCHCLTRPESRGIDVGDCVFRSPPLLISRGKDR